MMNDLYLKGCNATMRLYHDLHSDTIYKRFSDTQKAALCGWCGVRSWADVPPIWKQIEGTKTEEDLKRLLTTEWGRKFQGNINVLAYDIHFVKELLEAIRKVEFVDGPQATFLTVENGLSLMNLMPKSREEMARLDADQKLRDITAATATFADAKKRHKAPRLPPTQYDSLTNLLTVYALFLEMLFTDKNLHLRGLNDVRRALMSMNAIQQRLSRRYLATMSWAIANDTCRYFSECMPMEDLVDTSSAMLVWPRSNLTNFAYQMTAEQEINLMTFPEEWTAMLERSQQPMHQNAGRGGAYSWESPRKTASIDDSKDRGEQNKGRGDERTWRDRHPDRYGPMAINPHTPKTLFHLMERF